MDDRTPGGDASPSDRNPAPRDETFARRLQDTQAALAEERLRCAGILEALQRAEFRSASLFRQLAQTEDHLTEQKQRLADERSRARHLEERNRNLEKVIGDIHASTSWKVSYPIRWLKRLIGS
jgi:septal ring factor EnvC (AmiA/AmiB activator)